LFRSDVMGTAPNMVVLCGIPGCGKTSLVNDITTLSNDTQSVWGNFLIWHINFDAIFDDVQKKINGIDFHEWKIGRNEAFFQVKHILAPHETNHCILPPIQPIKIHPSNQLTKVIFVDDNMYYRSMRHSFYQLAKKYKAGFSQIYINTPLGACITNNEIRGSSKVSELVIRTIQDKLEVPSPLFYTWERHTLFLSCEINSNDLFEKLAEFWEDPLPNDEALREGQEKSRLINMLNVVHQFDIRARKMISGIISKYKLTHGLLFDANIAQCVRKELGKKKQEMLTSIQKLTHNNNIDNIEVLIMALEIKFVKYCNNLNINNIGN